MHSDQGVSTPKCSKQSTKLCELHCEQCNIPMCNLCVSSGDHLGHEQVDTTLKSFETKKDILSKDLQKLKKSFYPKYKEAAPLIHVQKADINRNSHKLTTAIEKHGEDLHRKIDNMIVKLKSDMDEMNFKHLQPKLSRKKT